MAVVFTIPRTTAQGTIPQGDYTLIVDGYDWGLGVSKVVVSMEEMISETSAADFTVTIMEWMAA